MQRPQNEPGNRLPAGGLSYPFPAAPAAGTIREIASGVKWLRIPVPVFDHINVYLLQAGEAWLIVDTGLDAPDARAAWRQLLSGPLKELRCAGIVGTHHHPDHIGLAGWLCDCLRVPFFMTRTEYLSACLLASLREAAPPWQHRQLMRELGVPEDQAELLLPYMAAGAKTITPLPRTYRRLDGASCLPLASGHWEILTGTGHSPEHASLYCAQSRLLLAGDQLLPAIASNISPDFIEEDEEPLSGWLMSLERISELPDDTLVLPAHGMPFRNIRGRVQQLRDRYQAKFDIILRECGQQAWSARELTGAVFPAAEGFHLMLGLGECVAYLRHLAGRGLLRAENDARGVLRYTLR